MKRLVVSVMALVASLAIVGTASAGGPSGPAFYVDGEIYRTVGTPTDLAKTGAPDHSFDIFRDPQVLNVASAAPGDRDFNGGRWIVIGVHLDDLAAGLADDDVDFNDNDVLDSEEEVLAAIDAGYATNQGELRRFVCTVNKIPHGN